MTGIVIADREKQETFRGIFEGSTISAEWWDSPSSGSLNGDIDFVLDLDFRPEPARLALLAGLPAPLILINAVPFTLQELAADERFARINAWNTFLQRSLAEAVVHPSHFRQLETLCSAWNKKLEIVPDLPGMPSVRIVAAIVNEAYYAWGEQVSTREAIDVAMRLGTNYPHGPFEWCAKIGIGPVFDLLKALSKENPRYTIAPLLREEALAHGPVA